MYFKYLFKIHKAPDPLIPRASAVQFSPIRYPLPAGFLLPRSVSLMHEDSIDEGHVHLKAPV